MLQIKIQFLLQHLSKKLRCFTSLIVHKKLHHTTNNKNFLDFTTDEFQPAWLDLNSCIHNYICLISPDKNENGLRWFWTNVLDNSRVMKRIIYFKIVVMNFFLTIFHYKQFIYDNQYRDYHYVHLFFCLMHYHNIFVKTYIFYATLNQIYF